MHGNLVNGEQTDNPACNILKFILTHPICIDQSSAPGLYGKDQREAALIDMMDEAIQDLLNKYVKLMFEKDVSVQMYDKCNHFDLNPSSPS